MKAPATRTASYVAAASFFFVGASMGPARGGRGGGLVIVNGWSFCQLTRCAFSGGTPPCEHLRANMLWVELERPVPKVLFVPGKLENRRT